MMGSQHLTFKLTDISVPREASSIKDLLRYLKGGVWDLKSSCEILEGKG